MYCCSKPLNQSQIIEFDDDPIITHRDSSNLSSLDANEDRKDNYDLQIYQGICI